MFHIPSLVYLCGEKEISMNINKLTQVIIGAAIEVHRALGPGLLESAYEECLCRELSLQQIQFERQKLLPLEYKKLKIECGYRLDLLVLDFGTFCLILIRMSEAILGKV